MPSLGKDPSKVDRSAAYASRYVAKNIVAAGLADYCEIQVSYAIGVAKPTSIHVETFNSEKISKDAIVKIVEEEFDLRPKSLINMLDLKDRYILQLQHMVTLEGQISI